MVKVNGTTYGQGISGPTDAKKEEPKRIFAQSDAKNRERLLKMLATESKMVYSPKVKKLYQDLGNASIRVEKIIYTHILNMYGFTSCVESMNNYINAHILGGHYVSHEEYDPMVMSAVPRLAKNKWLYRETSGPPVGGTFPNCVVYTLDGKQMGIFDHIRSVHSWADIIFICGASSS